MSECFLADHLGLFRFFRTLGVIIVCSCLLSLFHSALLLCISVGFRLFFLPLIFSTRRTAHIIIWNQALVIGISRDSPPDRRIDRRSRWRRRIDLQPPDWSIFFLFIIRNSCSCTITIIAFGRGSSCSSSSLLAHEFFLPATEIHKQQIRE